MPEPCDVVWVDIGGLAENTMDQTDRIELPDAAIRAYLRLIELNLGSWRPQVAEWLHSSEAEAPLKELLLMVPCSPTLH